MAKAHRFSPAGKVADLGTEVLLELLSIAEEQWCDEGPDPLRVQLRNMKGRLGGSYIASETDVAQELAELDGDDVDG